MQLNEKDPLAFNAGGPFHFLKDKSLQKYKRLNWRRCLVSVPAND